MDSWQETDKGLYKQFEFSDFQSAFSFMKLVAEHAEQINHHPTWSNNWNKVEIWLISHDAGDVITEKDRSMATAIDKLFTLYYSGQTTK